jgi:two-component system aerobic respiration control protein ArcA
MAKTTIDCKQLVSKIARLVRERIEGDAVVDLKLVREFRQPITHPPVIWLIEDDESLRRALVRIFEGEGYQIYAAAAANEIEPVLSSRAPDLILLDIGLPWINGFELAELMKAQPELQSVPIVFISGHDTPNAIKRGFSVGAHDFITKPFDVQNVRKTVRTLLELT